MRRTGPPHVLAAARLAGPREPQMHGERSTRKEKEQETVVHACAYEAVGAEAEGRGALEGG
jgi:hypothetical protein